MKRKHTFIDVLENRPHIILMIGWMIYLMIGVILNRNILGVSIVIGVLVILMELVTRSTHATYTAPEEDDPDELKFSRVENQNEYVDKIMDKLIEDSLRSTYHNNVGAVHLAPDYPDDGNDDTDNSDNEKSDMEKGE